MALDFAFGPINISLEEYCCYELNYSHFMLIYAKNKIWTQITVEKILVGSCNIQTPSM